jgi:glycosyltransferase involved in cell wall biosynthesis
MNNVDISVVVVTHNRASMLRRGLETIINQVTAGRFSYEVLVVDDGSTDNTATVVQQAANNSNDYSTTAVRYVFQNKGGEARARNRGIKAACGRWIAFIDDDELAEADWLGELYGVARTKGADCVDGPIHLLLPANFQAGLAPRIRAHLGEKFVTSDDGRKSPKDTLGTNNVLLNTAIFGQIGDFDVAIGYGPEAYGTDADFFTRLEDGGFKIAYAPRALVHHVIPESRMQVFSIKRSFFKGGVASAQIHFKNYGRSKVLTHMAWRLGVILGRDIPLLVLASLLRCQPLILESLAGVSATAGYFWGSLRLLKPGLFVS